MIDITSLNIVATSINAAKELTKAAVGLRDFNQVATAVSEINAKLLDAQDGLFKVKSTLLDLQQEHIKCMNELRDLKASMAQRDEHSLVQLSEGTFVYVSKPLIEQAGGWSPVAYKQIPCFCQHCFDNGRKVALSQSIKGMLVFMHCPGCGVDLRTVDAISM